MKKIWILILFFFLISCTNYAQLKNTGFKNFIDAHNMVLNENEQDDFHKVIELKMKVHIVSSRKQFNIKSVLVLDKVIAYATRNNEIYIIGHKLDGFIIINQAILGHEVAHLLNWADPKIPDPDKEKTIIPMLLRVRRGRRRRRRRKKGKSSLDLVYVD